MRGSRRPTRRRRAEPTGPRLEHRRDLVRGLEMSSLVARPAEPGRAGAAHASPDLLIVHGLSLSYRYLQPAVERLAADRRVLAPDLPGVGRSERPPHRLSAAELVDRIVQWMDGQGVGTVDVVGHSLGAQLAATLAATHPERVRRLVLASPSRDPQNLHWWQSAWRLLLDAPREHPSLVRIAVSDYLRAGPLRSLQTLRRARRADVGALLRSIRQRTVVVVGARDPLASPEWLRDVVAGMPDAELVTVPGAPHGLPYSAVDDFVGIVRAAT